MNVFCILLSILPGQAITGKSDTDVFLNLNSAVNRLVNTRAKGTPTQTKEQLRLIRSHVSALEQAKQSSGQVLPKDYRAILKAYSELLIEVSANPMGTYELGQISDLEEDLRAKAEYATIGEQSIEFISNVDAIQALAFSSDGNNLVGGGSAGKLMSWDPSTGKNVWKYEGNGGPILSIAGHPERDTFIYTTRKGRLRAVSAKGNRPVSDPKFDLLAKRINARGGAGHCFFTESNMLMCSDLKGGKKRPGIGLWHTGKGSLMKYFRGFDSGIGSISISNSGRFVAVTDQKKARVWDAKKNSLLRDFKSEYALTAARFAPDDEHIYLGSTDGKVYAWDLKKGVQAKWQKKLHNSPVWEIFAIPNGKIVTIASIPRQFGEINILDMDTGRVISRHVYQSAITAVAISKKGVIAFAHENGYVRVWFASKKRSNPFAKIKLTVHTRQGNNDKPGYIIRYVPKAFKDDPNRFERFFDPSTPTTWGLRAGNYAIWGTKGNIESHKDSLRLDSSQIPSFTLEVK